MEFIDKKINESLNNEVESGFEATTSNFYKRLTDNRTCAIISPFKDGDSLDENLAKVPKLKGDVRNLRLGFNQFISRWVDDSGAYDEQSLLIPDITYQQAFRLGQKYEQKSIIFKDSESCREICTRDFSSNGENYQPGDVVRVFQNSGNHVLNLEEAKAIFSRKVAGPASKPVKSKRPFTLKEKSTTEAFELYELEQPKPSYFETKPKINRIF